MTTSITTERFYLRELTLDDVTDRYLQWFRDPEAEKYIVASVATRTLADLRAYVAARVGRADVLFLGIFDKTTGEHIGNLKYEPINAEQGYAVMGILIGADYRGRGVGPEVLAASARWLRDHRAITQVILTVRRDHAHAIRAYVAAGFAQEDTPYLVPQHGDVATMVLRR